MPDGTVSAMPTLARFYGIRVRMRWREHPPPHFHVEYQGHKASIEIESLEIIRGRLPKRARVLVLEWAMQHRGEIRQAWNSVQNRQSPPTIEPLD
jgi:Domain of unknown function (DUF4160)